jgi:hypothetical protein
MAEVGIDNSAVDVEGVANLAAELGNGTVFSQRSLEVMQSLADLVDQGALAAKVIAVDAATVTIAKTIVWAVGFCAAAAPGGVDGPMHSEELGPGQ